MDKQINLWPEILDLLLYAGDGVSLKLLCTNGNNAPVDITGSVKAQIKLNRISTDAPIVEFAANMIDAYQGIILLSLTGDQTKLLIADPSVTHGKFVGVWDLQWSPAGAQPRTLLQGTVECVADVSR